MWHCLCFVLSLPGMAKILPLLAVLPAEVFQYTAFALCVITAGVLRQCLSLRSCRRLRDGRAQL